MKALLISIHPQWVELILNLIKKDEIRKGTAIGKAINKLIKEQGVAPTFIYCTKALPLLLKNKDSGKIFINKLKAVEKDNLDRFPHIQKFNGKVVARFNATAEEIKYHFGYYDMGEWTESYILEKSCLTAEELDNYLQASKDYDETKVSKVYGCAIHINDLEIFDKPKEISEFSIKVFPNRKDNLMTRYLTRAPESWCYIEI